MSPVRNGTEQSTATRNNIPIYTCNLLLEEVRNITGEHGTKRLDAQIINEQPIYTNTHIDNSQRVCL